MMKDPGNKLIVYSVIGVVLFYWGFSQLFNKEEKKEN